MATKTPQSVAGAATVPSKIDFSRVIIDRRILERLLNTHALSFTMQLQLFSNWCWAATATSVSKYYKPASTWTQCKVASVEKNINSCCNSPLPAGCNTYGTLGSSLTTVGQFNFSEGAASTTWTKVKNEILAGRPIGARTAWSGGGAHFVAIYGYQEYGGQKYLMIDDPIYGKSTMTLATFMTSYRGSGTWTHTYYTK
jgi:hypothetical protein